MGVFETPVISASILSSVSIHPSRKTLAHDMTEYLALAIAPDVARPRGEGGHRLPAHPYQGEYQLERCFPTSEWFGMSFSSWCRYSIPRELQLAQLCWPDRGEHISVRLGEGLQGKGEKI